MKIHVRGFDSNFNKIIEDLLDLEKIGNSKSLSSNSLIIINNLPYLIAGIHTGPPIKGQVSDIYLIPLNEDLLKIKGKPKILIQREGEYSTAPKSSRILNNILYISYAVRNMDNTKIYVEGCDISNNFSSIGRALIEAETIRDNHTHIAIINNKIVAFYEYENKEIIAKVLNF
jgi:hypothetical protein